VRRGAFRFGAGVLLAVLVAVGLPAGVAAGPAEDIDGARRRAQQATEERSQAEAEVAMAEAEIVAARARVRQAQDQVATLIATVRRQAASQYAAGGPLEVPWLDMEDANTAARAKQMAEFVTEDAAGAVDGLEEARDRLEDAAEDLDQALAERKARLEELRRLEDEATKALEALARAERERQAAARAAARRPRVRSSAPRAPRSRAAPAPAPDVILFGVAGVWLCPVAGPHTFTNDFGAPRSGGRSHQGIDVMAARGTPVVASVPGVVRHHNSSLGGMAYYLAGDDGIEYYGAHLDGFGASGRVEAGTVVGYVGTSGNASATAPHLHFEIHQGGTSVNPYATLVRYCGTRI
jgi:murein DD-endopeptidase MepM/ murein hydrolase activator NlpD